jgi:hypothetical protein
VGARDGEEEMEKNKEKNKNGGTHFFEGRMKALQE